MYPLMKILPLLATTPFFTHSEILVVEIGMQEEELHSGVTRILPALGFLTLVSLNHTCLSLYLLKIKVTPRKFIVIGNIYRPPNAENHISEFNTKLAFILEKIHEQYSGAYDVQLCLDSNIDLFQISSSHHSEYFNTLLAAGHLPLITVPTRTMEVTRSNGGSGITQTLIDHITSKRPVPPPLRCN